VSTLATTGAQMNGATTLLCGKDASFKQFTVILDAQFGQNPNIKSSIVQMSRLLFESAAMLAVIVV
jgi:hypothetical protein